jgi:hypothetical protein
VFDGGPVEQVLQVGAGIPQPFLVCGPPLLSNEVIGIIAGRQHGDVDLEPFRHQQL